MNPQLFSAIIPQSWVSYTSEHKPLPEQREGFRNRQGLGRRQLG